MNEKWFGREDHRAAAGHVLEEIARARKNV